MSRGSSLEFKHRFAEEMRRTRLEQGYQTVEELAEATRIPVVILRNLELGKFREPTTIFRLARFYKKRVRIEFFD